MNIYGYIRVSSRDQNEDRQLLSLKQIGVLERIFIWISSRAEILTVRNIEKWYEN